MDAGNAIKIEDSHARKSALYGWNTQRFRGYSFRSVGRPTLPTCKNHQTGGQFAAEENLLLM